MILAYHVIFCAYGFWLPNDPRGSWSDFVRQWELVRFGQATKTDTRRSVAGRTHDVAHRQVAKQALQHPPVSFTGSQAREMGHGFADMIRKSNYTVHACAILPEHVHMVIGRLPYRVEQAVRLLKQSSARRLTEMELNTMPAGVSPWARNCWKVYLNTPADVCRAIDYVQRNPAREGKPSQRWSFVVPYDV